MLRTSCVHNFVFGEQRIDKAYADAPFVRLPADSARDQPLAHTNCCDIGLKVDLARTRVRGQRIDNLVGRVGTRRFQNFTVMHGFDQKAGLL